MSALNHRGPSVKYKSGWGVESHPLCAQELAVPHKGVNPASSPPASPAQGQSSKAIALQNLPPETEDEQDTWPRAELRWGSWRRREASCGSCLFWPVHFRGPCWLSVDFFSSAPKCRAGVKPSCRGPPPPGRCGTTSTGLYPSVLMAAQSLPRAPLPFYKPYMEGSRG